MCGIISYSGKDEVDVDLLKILLLQSQQRGTDSTGVGWIETKETKKVFKTIKDTIGSTDFVWQYDDELPKEQKNLVAHTRNSSTATSKTYDDAHPFMFSRLVGVHNGYISNYKALNTKYKLNYTVDSRTLYHLINEKGIKETLKEVRGSMALAWINPKGQLCLYRHQNPTYVGQIKGNMYIASTRDYLKSIGAEEINMTKENHLYTIEDGQLLSYKNIGKPKESSYNNYSGYGCGYHGHDYQGNSKHTDKKKDDVDKKAVSDSKILKCSDLLEPGEGVPEDATPTYQDGMMHYFWLETEEDKEYSFVAVTSIYAYGSEKNQRFYLNKEGKQALKDQFNKIYNYLNLDSDDE